MTDQTKTPGPAATDSEGSKQNITPTQYKLLTPRLKRLLAALVAAEAGLPRETCDRVTPCSNSPEYVRQLREKLLLDIPCPLIPFVTIDGQNSQYGLYHLTGEDRARLARVME